MGARTQAECKGGKADKDWIGNCKSIYTILGASNHSPGVRQKDDYYATEPKAMELLLHEERFALLFGNAPAEKGIWRRYWKSTDTM